MFNNLGRENLGDIRNVTIALLQIFARGRCAAMKSSWVVAPLLASALLVLALVPANYASAVVTVPHDWPLIPRGLEMGDEFRLLFASYHHTSITNNHGFEVFDNFVTRVAREGHSSIQQYAGEFKALVSCGNVNAMMHTSTTHTPDNPGLPIYWLKGAKVADDYADFYDGNWDSNQARNQYGIHVYTNPRLENNWHVNASYHTVWTGTNSDGTSSNNHACSSSITVGKPHTHGSEIQHWVKPTNHSLGMYGVSPVFQVSVLPDPPSAPNVSSITHNTASITWKAPAHEGATPIFDYNVQIRTAGGTWVGSTPFHWGTHTNLTLTGLSPDTEYEVRVFAKNHRDGGSETGYGPTSPVTTFHTKTITPSAPGKPVVTPGTLTAQVSWAPPAWAGSPPFHDYDMTISPATPGVNVGVHGTGTTFTITGLNPDTTYQVQVRANNSAGSSPWSPATSFLTVTENYQNDD